MNYFLHEGKLYVNFHITQNNVILILKSGLVDPY